MRERPIIFSGPMVRAILDGRKTQTRRIVRPQSAHGYVGDILGQPQIYAVDAQGTADPKPIPFRYGVPGDRLWVRETWGGDAGCGFAYRADHPDWPHFQGDGEQPDSPWRPSIFMPRWASRLTLEVTEVRVQRLQEISEEDAKAEGVEPCGCKGTAAEEWCTGKPYHHGLAAGWDSINGKRAPWGSNPWVWAITFKRIAEVI